jgi:two-component SAPR family response regulator
VHLDEIDIIVVGADLSPSQGVQLALSLAATQSEVKIIGVHSNQTGAFTSIDFQQSHAALKSVTVSHFTETVKDLISRITPSHSLNANRCTTSSCFAPRGDNQRTAFEAWPRTRPFGKASIFASPSM